MLTFIPQDLLVLQKIESTGLDGGGTFPGLCPCLDRVCLFSAQFCFRPSLFRRSSVFGRPFSAHFYYINYMYVLHEYWIVYYFILL